MIRLPPRSTRAVTLFPSTTRFRSPRRLGRRQIQRPHDGGGGVFRRPRALCTVQRLAVPGLRRREGGPDRNDRRGTEPQARSEKPTPELQSLMRISYAAFCLNTKIIKHYLNTIFKSHET